MQGARDPHWFTDERSDEGGHGMKKEIKVVVKFTDGYQERFTKACIKAAERQTSRKKEELQEPKKAAV